MNLRRFFVAILGILSFTCFSCAHDIIYEDENILVKKDSTNLNNNLPNNNNDSISGNSNSTTPLTENNPNDPDTTFVEITSTSSIANITLYMGLSSNGEPVQGAAAFGDYMFHFKDYNAAVYIYNLAQKSFIKKISLTSNKNNHCNQASFSNIFYSEKDKFPLLYVSGAKSSGTYNQIQVYRIKGENEAIEIEQIQEIILPQRNDSNWVYWTCSILDNENHYLYAYASNANTRLIKFNIPDYHQGTVYLTDDDIIEYIPLEHIDHQQGGIIRDGIFYMVFGVPAWGDQVWLRVFNIGKKEEIIRLNLSEVGFNSEPESIFFYNNGLYCITRSGIYKIVFTKGISQTQ